MKFFDADSQLIRERPLLTGRSVDGFHEAVYPLSDDIGAVHTKWKATNENLEDISHEVLDARGAVLLRIEGKDVPEAVRPAPNFGFLVGWSSYMGSAGEPFSFFDSEGKFQRRVDGVFCPAGTSQCGGGVELAFSPAGDAVVISVRNRGLAVFTREGTLRWKKAVEGWAGGEPKFLPSSDRFVISGKVIRLETDQRVKSGALQWEDVQQFRMAERVKLLLPTSINEEGQGIYCYSTANETPLWTARGWGGAISVHQSQGFLAAGSASGMDRFRVGIFDKNGLVRTWEVPRVPATPALSWLDSKLVLLFEEVAYPAKGARTVRMRKKNGVSSLFVFDRGHDRPVWSKDGAKKGFDYAPAGMDKFVLSDEAGETLFEVK